MFCCYNKMMEDELGVKLTSKMDSFSLKDGEGNERRFSENERLYPIGIFMEAVENKENGYQLLFMENYLINHNSTYLD